MPTWTAVDRFWSDWNKLAGADRERFQSAVQRFIADLTGGQGFRPGLRVKRVEGTDGVWEMTWAPNGRATWQYGPEVRPGEPHIIWRRIGTHDVFNLP